MKASPEKLHFFFFKYYVACSEKWYELKIKFKPMPTTNVALNVQNNGKYTSQLSVNECPYEKSPSTLNLAK